MRACSDGYTLATSPPALALPAPCGLAGDVAATDVAALEEGAREAGLLLAEAPSPLVRLLLARVLSEGAGDDFLLAFLSLFPFFFCCAFLSQSLSSMIPRCPRLGPS